MRIFYEGSNFDPTIGQPIGGVSRIFKNLINLLPAEDVPILSLPTAGFHRRLEIDHPRLKLVDLDFNHRRPWRLWQMAQGPWKKVHRNFVNRHLDHPTHFLDVEHRPMRRRGKPLVMNVHDMIEELYPRPDDTEGYWPRIKKEAITQADLIVCISRHTESDLLEFIPEVKGRTRVVHLAAEPPLPSEAHSMPPALDGVEYPWFLYVGQRARNYKNFATAAEAVRQLNRRMSEPFAMVAAGPSLTDEEKAEWGDLLEAGKLISVPHPSEAELAWLYDHARALVYPSLYEGFGLPPLEAMQYETPVIAARAACIPEIVGDAALLFDPNSVDELTEHLYQALADEVTLKKLAVLGAARTSEFSWDKTARTIRECYQSII